MPTDNVLLMLDSKDPITTNKPNEWCGVESGAVENFIKNIETSKGSAAGQQDKFRAMVSGIPSPWARVLLTRKAILTPSEGLKDTVFDECCKLLKSEWRGLVAAYVLRPESFDFSEPLALVGKSVEENSGDMSVRYVYGQMLFEETPLWVHRCMKVDIKDNPPYIQILYYKKKQDGNEFKRIPVAATSPYTFLFSSVNYNLLEAQREIPWIDNDGKFSDPLSCPDLKLEDMQRLYSFLAMIKSNVRPGDNQLNDESRFYLDWLKAVCDNNDNKDVYKLSSDKVKESIDGWLEELGRWQQEIEAAITKKGGEVNAGIPLFNVKPQGPLALLMNSEHKFYFSDGVMYLNRISDIQTLQEILSSEIFIDSDFIAAWDNNVQNGKDYSDSAAYYVITEDSKYALPLPFTQRALEVFGNNLNSIVPGNSDASIRLQAKVVMDGVVEIELKARLDKSDKETPVCKKIYRMSFVPETDGKVFVWPNFSSPHWNKYYYYSEFPSNVSGVRMVPRFEDVDFLTASPEDVKNHYLVRYPVDRVASGSHKYEIIENAKPLRSISVRLNRGGEEVNAGVLVVKRTQDSVANAMREKPTLANLREAVVGIDFGSTNTCAYYKLMDGRESMPIPFSNRRLALVGFDSEPKALAGKDELLFISNEGTAFNNGQVKSWLHLHDPQYLTHDGDINNIADLSKEIIGGVPVNESNIVVKSMNEHVIQTNAGELHYNMKWMSEEESEKRKTAFMKMLWIHICADMVDGPDAAYPKVLYWSFPSSMNQADRKCLKRIYRTLEYPFYSEVSERPKLEDYTESEAVCAYSIYKGSEVNASTLNLGIDVGGSTSDILVVGLKGGENALMTQSSIRMAGGFFFNAINSSAKFRRSLYNFHESHNTAIEVKNISDIVSSDPGIFMRAPYYLNNVFDQLNTPRDFNSFYNYMRREVAPVFAYPAYVTGVLMFYSGMLVRNVVTKNGMEGLKTVEMRYYGKGGRLFEWLLDMFDDDSENYYRKCFNAGYGSSDVRLSIIHQKKDENKSEVAIGLVSDLFASIAKGEKDEDGQRIIERYDVVGEKGFKCTKTQMDLNELDIIPDELFDGGVNIEIPDKLENFSRFIDIFTKFLTDDSGGILKDVSGISKGKDKLRLRAFIQNDQEYIKCKKAYDSGMDEGKRPVYRMPLFIAAALCFLNEVLLPEVSNQMK